MTNLKRGLTMTFTRNFISGKRLFPFRNPVALFLIIASIVMSNVASAHEDAATYVLFRHAEKQSGTDPELTATGQRRAANLASLLTNVAIDHLWSSNYQRTRQTAAPLAEQGQMETVIYDAADLPSFALQLLSQSGVHVIVGHSNTTHELVTLLGGEGGDKIEESEYDRVYVVSRYGQHVQSLQLSIELP